MRFLNRRLFTLVLVVLVSGFGMASAQEEQEPPHWTYEGEEGPDHWGDLAEDYALCSTGRAQSPIDVAEPQGVNLQPITINYQAAPLKIFNNGHTIQVNFDEGSSITYNEIEYQLLQFHFHHPSEHTIDGVPAAMEIHFVHRNDAGNLAVVGVMLQEGDTANEAYASIFENLPAEASEPAESTELMVDLPALLPNTQTYYTYTGSLTTPPCSEGVRWLLMTEPVTLSAEQVEAFGAIFELNARPVQDLNTRDLLEDNAG